MNRPRIAVIVSAVAASTAAFFVTTRYHLAGTLAGAVLFPVIIILVSHSSTQGVDALHRWARSRRNGRPDGVAAPAAEQARPRARNFSQWWLAGLAGVAVAVSVYTLVAHGDPTVVRQTVIQRVTESSEASSSAPSTASTTEGSPSGTTATTEGTAVTSTTTTDTTATTATTTPPSDTTTTSTEGGEPSTTDTTQGSGVSLP